MDYTAATAKTKVINYNTEGRYRDNIDYNILNSAKIEDREIKSLVKYNKQSIGSKGFNKKLNPVVVRTKDKSINVNSDSTGVNNRYADKLVDYNIRHYMLYDTEHIHPEKDDKFIIQDYTNNGYKETPFEAPFGFNFSEETIGTSNVINKAVLINARKFKPGDKTL
jgi:hypothetical protein